MKLGFSNPMLVRIFSVLCRLFYRLEGKWKFGFWSFHLLLYRNIRRNEIRWKKVYFRDVDGNFFYGQNWVFAISIFLLQFGEILMCGFSGKDLMVNMWWKKMLDWIIETRILNCCFVNIWWKLLLCWIRCLWRTLWMSAILTEISKSRSSFLIIDSGRDGNGAIW